MSANASYPPAMLASLTSALVNIPLVWRLVRRAPLTRWIIAGVVLLFVLGAVGAGVQRALTAG